MSFDRAELLHLLPCHLCGDLPEGVSDQVEVALREDGELRAMYDTLVVSREECGRLLEAAREAVPELAELGQAPPPVHHERTVPPTRPWGLAIGVAAALLLTVAAAVQERQDPVEQGFFETHAAATQAPELLAGPGLPGALRAAGVEPRLAMAPDLSAQGFALVGVMPVPGGGVAVVYDKDGKRYVCQIYAAVPTSLHPDRVEQVGPVLMRGFERGDQAAVSWSSGGRTCVFSGEAPVGELLAVVRQRLQS
jgi:anti-sigma factor RsiW